MAYRRQVDADLVASRVVGAKLHQGAMFCEAAAQHFRSCGLSAEPFELAWVLADSDFAAVAWVGRDGRVDDQGRWDDSDAAREISLFDFAGMQHSAQLVERLWIPGRKHQTRGPGIEPV
jgi:hypothetical protein